MASESSAVVDTSGQPEAEGATSTDKPDRHTESRPQNPPGDLPLDVTFELLQNYRRRLTLRYLADNPSTTLSTLAEHVAAQENDKQVQMLTSQERKRVYISLYQSHLPKLDDARVIDFDSDRGMVHRTAAVAYLVSYLDRATESEVRVERPAWHYYFLGIALTGGGLLAAQLALLSTLAATAAVAVVVMAVIAGLALVHARHDSASHVTFRYHDHEVVVHSDGDIKVTPNHE